MMARGKNGFEGKEVMDNLGVELPLSSRMVGTESQLQGIEGEWLMRKQK